MGGNVKRDIYLVLPYIHMALYPCLAIFNGLAFSCP